MLEQMTAKRFRNEPESNQDQPAEKRRWNGTFSSIIGERAMVNSFPHLSSAIEPLVRKVVQEEVEGALRRWSCPITKSSSLRIQAIEPSNLQLIFPKSLSLPIFTASKVLDVDGNPLHLRIVDKSTGYTVPAALSRTIRVQIVVLDGDFAGAKKENWSSQEFEASIVKERTGKRPLIHGDVNIIMREGVASIGDIEFTDNSSWIRCRRFRIGARISPGSGDQGVRIREAVTQPFTVKDHRGELYKKHHPPLLGDEVWRLEKIGRGGKFHKKLSEEHINTVQDFLKLSTTDPQRLKMILGSGMSEKTWEITLKHARTCDMGKKMYVFRGTGFTLFLDPICRPVRGVINGEIYPPTAPSNIPKSCVESLVRQAYMCWHCLEEVDAAVNKTNLITHGNLEDGYVNLEHADSIRSQQSDFFEDTEIVVNNEISEVFGGATEIQIHGIVDLAANGQKNRRLTGNIRYNPDQDSQEFLVEQLRYVKHRLGKDEIVQTLPLNIIIVVEENIAHFDVEMNDLGSMEIDQCTCSFYGNFHSESTMEAYLLINRTCMKSITKQNSNDLVSLFPLEDGRLLCHWRCIHKRAGVRDTVEMYTCGKIPSISVYENR